ncbi:MAG: DUF6290 family protein [Methanomassiliicoccaceae archaeon]|nr:DUF6290 family protein [Methanomassiliicoccaceae archaeon]
MFSYAEINDISLSEVISVMLEKLEDEIDSKLGDDALDAFEKAGRKAIPHKEFWKGLDVL